MNKTSIKQNLLLQNTLFELDDPSANKENIITLFKYRYNNNNIFIPNTKDYYVNIST